MTTAHTSTGPDDEPSNAPDMVLRAQNVSVSYDGERPTRAVRDVSFELRRGEILGIAGESGCGKSTLAYALTRLLRSPARLTDGSVTFNSRDGGDPVDVMSLDAVALRRFRWSKVSMVFQSAMNALNPVTDLSKQFADIFMAHVPQMNAAARDLRSRELLEIVGIDPDRVRSFAHELSGGMRQRVAIAMALALRPEVVVMDEPTTGLDVVVQREILDEIDRLRQEFGLSIIFITHDVPLLLALSDRLAMMYAGEIVECSAIEPVARAPAHPYTRGLLRSFPELRSEPRPLRGVPGSPPDLREPIAGCAFAPRCSFCFAPCLSSRPRLRAPRHLATDFKPGHANEDLRPDVVRVKVNDADERPPRPEWRVACHLHDPELRPCPPSELLAGRALEPTSSSLTVPATTAVDETAIDQTSLLELRDLTVDFTQRDGSKFRAVDAVSFSLRAGETVALVGESGSGKSTVALTLGRLLKPTDGDVLLHGQSAGRRGRRLRRYRSEVQLVFQDPFASLNPSFSVAHHLHRPLRISGTARSDLDDAVTNLLRSVNLEPPHVFAAKYPHELSGGQRQRVALARALSPDPSVILADEPVSMLDASVRLEILRLLDELRRARNVAVLYITHDLATAHYVASRVMVMYRGVVVESGPAKDVILQPAHPYTRLLASAVPSPTMPGQQSAAERRTRQQITSVARRSERVPTDTVTGCRFRDRCPSAMAICATRPPDFSVGPSHVARCWLYDPSDATSERPSKPGVDGRRRQM